MMEPPWEKQVDRFCRQVQQIEQKLDFPPSQFLKLADVQNKIYFNLFDRDELLHNASLPVRYQIRVIKELLSRIESGIDDWDEYGISDDLMSSLTSLLAASPPSDDEAAQKRAHVVYHPSLLPVSQAQITILETPFLLAAGGTTGLRTWEAALHLGQYLCQNPDLVASKRILELGAGTGYLSILCAKYLHATHVIASDGSDDVINNLPDNLFLNQLQGSNTVRPMELKWGHALLGTEDEKWNEGRHVDMVLGADITYDDTVNAALVGTLLDLFEMFTDVEVIIAATQRNQQTFQSFLDRCQRSKLGVKEEVFEVPPRQQQEGPFYDDRISIRICRVFKLRDE